MYSATRDEAYEIEALVDELAERIGLRRPTSPEEARAAAFVNGRLRRAGMGVSTYELRAVPRPGTGSLLFGALGVTSALLALALPGPGLLLSLGLLAVALVDGLVAPLPAVGRRRVSQNIVGTRAVAGAGGLMPAEPRWRVLLLAPLDTPAQQPGLAALASTTRAAVLSRLGAATLLVAGSLLAALLPGPWWLVQLAAALLFVLILVGATRPFTADPVDGGQAALAALVAAVSRLGPMERVELWAVAVGAAGSDPGGVTSLLQRYPFERERTLVIALEQLIGGQLVYATAEGALRSRPADDLLVRLAAATDAADPQIDADPRRLTTDGILASPLRRLGYRTLTIVASPAPGGVAAPAPPAARLVERVARLVTGIVQRLEAER